ncbi:MAG: amidohydrolase family protein [Halanaerobiales bacterium]
MKIKSISNIETINLLSAPAFFGYTQNLINLSVKRTDQDNIFVFGGLIHKLPGDSEPLSFVEQLQKLIAIGVDGIKMIEGKPTVIKELGYSIDDLKYDKFYSLLENKAIPLLMHVGDPATFWQREKIPDWALENAWFYGDGTFPELEELYLQVNYILERFPDLNLILAHFYFMSDDIDSAAGFLDTWPNVKFDITPGFEMYSNFTKEPDRWHQFFTRYQDRILFGTDNFGSMALDEARSKIMYMKKVLEKDGFSHPYFGSQKGLCLQTDILEKIYYKNYIKHIGDKAKKINLDLLREECNRLKNIADNNNDTMNIKEIEHIKNNYLN